MVDEKMDENQVERNEDAVEETPAVDAVADTDDSADETPVIADPRAARELARGSREEGERGRRKRGEGGGRDRGRRDQQQEEADKEWKEKVIQIRRVTKVVKGGKKLSFRAVVVVGNGKGQVGIGIGKSNEVIGAIQKGIVAAKKTLITVPLHNTTIPHAVKAKAGGSVVVLRPASKGTGVIAGGAARALLELAGVENILSKSLGSSSPLNVARATLRGLSELRRFDTIAASRGKSVKEILF